MFSFVTKTWNPVVGCMHNCVYCWARQLANTKLRETERYRNGFTPQLIKKELNVTFRNGDFVFVCDMGDLFGNWVPSDWIYKVLNVIGALKFTDFLLLTKNPQRYMSYPIPTNCILGATIESDQNYQSVSDAPLQFDRLYFMLKLAEAKRHKLFISIEPILDFNLELFANMLIRIRPWAVAIGYDNYGCGLPEPSLAKTMKLIEKLENANITVYRKTLREKTAVKRLEKVTNVEAA